MGKAKMPPAPIPDIGDPIITPAQAASILRVKERTVVRTLYNQGRGPLRGFRVSERFIRFFMSDLRAYVEAQRQEDGNGGGR
jgi:Helix-turn-helix domain